MTSRWAENLVSPALLLATQIYSPESPTPTPPNTKDPPTAHTPLLGVKGVDPRYHLQERTGYIIHPRVTTLKWFLYLGQNMSFSKTMEIYRWRDFNVMSIYYLQGRTTKFVRSGIARTKENSCQCFCIVFCFCVFLFGKGAESCTQTVVK